MFYLVEFLQLTVVRNINNGFSALVIGCYFIYDHNFTIFCDDLMTKL